MQVTELLSGGVPSPWFLPLAGLALYWFALPPVGWWPLAWLVLAPWTVLIARLSLSPPRRWWLKLWLSGTVFWMAALYWIPLPHPLMWIAWPLLSGYCALYFVAFVWVSRRLVHLARWPTLLVLPLTWAVIEWLRGWMITGFSMANLSHSQYRQPVVIQLASIGGDYAVSWLLAIAGTVLAIAAIETLTVSRLTSLITGLTLVASLLWAGNAMLPWQTKGAPIEAIAFIVQGSIDTEFPDSPAEFDGIIRKQIDQYQSLSVTALGETLPYRPFLLIWPESMFPQVLPTDSSLASNVAVGSDPELILAKRNVEAAWNIATGRSAMLSGPGSFPAYGGDLLTGAHSIDVHSGRQFNSAALIRQGEISAIYHKNHRVIFGEYVPLAEWFTFLDVGPNGRSLSAGKRAGLISWNQFRLMPEICFETTVPHLVTRHWRELDEQGAAPTGIVNLTNDGWFFGASCLDLHLACNVFRAVETGTPVYVAANTGLSAEIDGWGQLLQVGPRRKTAILRVELERHSGAATFYVTHGDRLWRALGLTVALGLIVGQFRAIRGSRKPLTSASPDNSGNPFK